MRENFQISPKKISKGFKSGDLTGYDTYPFVSKSHIRCLCRIISLNLLLKTRLCSRYHRRLSKNVDEQTRPPVKAPHNKRQSTLSSAPPRLFSHRASHVALHGLLLVITFFLLINPSTRFTTFAVLFQRPYFAAIAFCRPF